jgi:hypothetical protein
MSIGPAGRGEARDRVMETGTNSSRDRPRVARLSAAQRSRLSNGKEVLPDIDGRSAEARRFRDIANAVLADQGGASACSESRLQLVRRFAASAMLAERLEAKVVSGHDIDIQEHALLCSTLCRLAQRIGLGRRLKTVPHLADYLDDRTNEKSGHELESAS